MLTGGATALNLVVFNVTRESVLGDRVEVSDSLWAKFRGLMGRHSLEHGAGLWLPESNGIHMMFMRFPIDGVFLGRPNGNGEREVVAVRTGLRPWTGVVWYVGRAKGVLELPVGVVERSGTQVGDFVRLDPAV